MSFKNTQNYKDFLELYNDNPERVIFFVGAGLSTPLFPSWTNLLKTLVNIVDGKGKLGFDKTEILTKIESGQSFLEIADHCAEVLGKNEYREIIEKHFDKDFTLQDVPSPYKTLLSLTFKSIITSNYDRIPEVGGLGNFSCYSNQNISEALKAIEKGKKIVIKIHGDILNQDSIVLTKEDFKKIIHNSPDVQNALRSLFSTSTFCFVGFGLTDPHFNLLLEFLNSINNGLSVMHYAFLTGKSKFEIHNIEKTNGIKVIEYTPTNASHPEVEEFINSLKVSKNPSIPSRNVNSVNDLISLTETKFQTYLGLQNFYIDLIDRTLVINYFSRARTEYEQQKEILAIYSQFDIETNIIDNIKICCLIELNPNIEYVKYSPVILVCTSGFNEARKLSCKSISNNEFWTKLKFKQPFMIGNIHFIDRTVNFPHINY